MTKGEKKRLIFRISDILKTYREELKNFPQKDAWAIMALAELTIVEILEDISED